MSQGSERRAREQYLSIRLTADERAEIEQKAERAGLRTGSYARRVLLDAQPPRQIRRPPLEKVLLVKFLGELGRVGNNLNQLARDMNFGEGIDGIGLAEDIRDLRRMRDAVLDALGRGP